MLRPILTAVTVVEALAPEKLLAAAERVALENPAECKRRSWVVPGARLEAVAILFLMWYSDDSYSAFRKLLGVVGLLALLFPRGYVEYGSGLAYVDASTCEWKPWVYPGTRAVGLLYVAVALTELWRSHPLKSPNCGKPPRPDSEARRSAEHPLPCGPTLRLKRSGRGP